MNTISFTDVLRKAGFDPARVLLIRHPLSHIKIKDYYDEELVLAHTQQQKNGFAKGYDYWCVFIGDKNTLAKFYTCYKVKGTIPSATPDMLPKSAPRPEWFTGNEAFFDLEPVDALKEYENRLIVEWGGATRAWYQKGTTEKPIVSIQTDEKIYFTGFENLVLTYDRLKEIIENPSTYDTWHTALSSVHAIYLIVDLLSGQQYVGSAYGENGLLGRWTDYVVSHHGGNKKMKELLKKEPERYHHFQFSILQLLPKTITAEDTIKTELLYKKKLGTIEFGLNDN